MPKNRIVINVYGGCVQDVFCSDSAAEIVVVDWDTEGSTESEPGCVAVLGDDGREQIARVAFFPVDPITALAGTDAGQAVEQAEKACGSA